MPQYHDDTITLNESHCKTPEQNHNHPAWHFQHLVGDQSGDFKSESQDELMWWTSFSSYRYNTIHGIRKAGGITITWVCDRDRAPVIMMPNTVAVIQNAWFIRLHDADAVQGWRTEMRLWNILPRFVC